MKMSNIEIGIILEAKDAMARMIVQDYILAHFVDKRDELPSFYTYVVWKSKILQHYKYLVSSSLPDGMYYEVTYNADKDEWYLDVYKKFDKQRIPND